MLSDGEFKDVLVGLYCINVAGEENNVAEGSSTLKELQMKNSAANWE